jgi:hypothetical protein
MRRAVKPAEMPAREDALEYTIGNRAEILAKWLRENAPECAEEQAHLDEGSEARAYWNYGYLVALRDVLDVLTGRRRGLN